MLELLHAVISNISMESSCSYNKRKADIMTTYPLTSIQVSVLTVLVSPWMNDSNQANKQTFRWQELTRVLMVVATKAQFHDVTQSSLSSFNQIAEIKPDT